MVDVGQEEEELTLVYQDAKSTSFLTPMAIWAAPSILASSFSFAADLAAEVMAAGGSAAAALAKSSSLSFVDSVSSDLRYFKISAPERKKVDEDELAWTAREAEVDEIVGSTTVVTLEKLSLFSANGDTVPENRRYELKELSGTHKSFCPDQRIL